MNEILFHPENHKPQWLPSLGLATALHILLLLAVFYAPGFVCFRKEVREVVHLVNIIDLAEPCAPEATPSPRQTALSQPARREVSPTPSVGKEPAPSQATAHSPAPVISEQPGPAPTESSVYGQGAQPLVEAGERGGVRQTAGRSGATDDTKTGTVSAAPAGTGAEGRESARQRYLTGLLAHVEACKFYPGAARQRGLEGTVQVSFTVMPDGEIRQLALSGGHKMLHQAATETMRRALPLPAPPREVATPLAVSYGMSFVLR